MKRSNVILLVLVVVICYYSGCALAYEDSYPPYKVKDGPPSSLDLEALVDYDREEYKSEDGSIIAKLQETSDDLDFLVQEGNYILAEKQNREIPFPFAVYRADVDGNGLEDFIIFSSYRGCGLGALSTMTEMFLKKPEGGYQRIYYDSFCSGLEDIVDLDNDGKYELITLDMHYAGKHNYWAYNIYRFENYKLVNADAEFEGFPKFIWYTDKPNDKDTTHLNSDQRKEFTRFKDRLIRYEDRE